MEKNISIKELVNEIKNSDFALNCKMPMRYVPGLPILSVKCGMLCCVVPFLAYKITGEADKTEVYPVKYTITAVLPEGKIVGFEDLTLNPDFENTEFDKPVGYFRHDAIKNLGKKAYEAKRDELYTLYDKVVSAVLYDADYTREDEEQFTNLINLLLEPSQKPFYRLLDEDFCDKYIR